MAAAATTDGIPDRLALLRDNGEGCSYLVDTGSAYSILPFTSSAQPTGPALTATSGASIKAWGRCRMQISTGSRHFISRFLQAEVAFPIIGADFLVNFKHAAVVPSGPEDPAGGATCRQSHSSGHRGGGLQLITFTSHSGGTFLYSYTSHRGGTRRQRPQGGSGSAT